MNKPNPHPAGYSGTPLVKKLGFKPPLTVLVQGAPPEYPSWLDGLDPDVKFIKRTTKPVQAAHLFVKRRRQLEEKLTSLRDRLQPAGFVWVSWPKNSSGFATDVSEDTIREVALPLGFVDIKVCAVSDIWSGLKLMIRKSQRK